MSAEILDTNRFGSKFMAARSNNFSVKPNDHIWWDESLPTSGDSRSLRTHGSIAEIEATPVQVAACSRKGF